MTCHVRCALLPVAAIVSRSDRPRCHSRVHAACGLQSLVGPPSPLAGSVGCREDVSLPAADRPALTALMVRMPPTRVVVVTFWTQDRLRGDSAPLSQRTAVY